MDFQECGPGRRIFIDTALMRPKPFQNERASEEEGSHSCISVGYAWPVGYLHAEDLRAGYGSGIV